MKVMGEFREFILRGNVVDMAVGIIIGSAFTLAVQSLVKDVIMPPIGLATGGQDFKDLFLVLKQGAEVGPYPTVDAAQAAGAVTVNYGMFFNNVMSLILVGFAVFLIVRAVNRLQRREEPPPPASTKDCPFCATAIPIPAVRCPHCTSELQTA
jgi:large conductance mechanosensitive channel